VPSKSITRLYCYGNMSKPKRFGKPLYGRLDIKDYAKFERIKEIEKIPEGVLIRKLLSLGLEEYRQYVK
jgi:hypothetical protein